MVGETLAYVQSFYLKAKVSYRYDFSALRPPCFDKSSQKGKLQVIITPTDKLLGKKLRQIREAKGFSQERLAKEIGVVFQQIQKYETGVNRLSCSRLLKILDVLNISVIDFFADISVSDHPLVSREEQLLFRAYRQKSPQAQQAILILLGDGYKF